MNIRPLESLTKEELIELIRHERREPSDDAIYALKLALEYWADRQQRYRNRQPICHYRYAGAGTLAATLVGGYRYQLRVGGVGNGVVGS